MNMPTHKDSKQRPIPGFTIALKVIDREEK